MLNETMHKTSNGIYKKEAEYQDPPSKGRKAYRSQDMNQSLVTIDSIVFNADEKSMDRMDRVVDIANWKFNQAVANGTPKADAYAAVYQGNTLQWKTADNTIVTVTVEQICRVQENALNNMSQIWFQYG